MSKPRVFISSTYYDLKYVRERIEHFISAYCFEPILFESDSVYFHPNKNLDTSCYNEVSNCHLMMLIIGGRYGSLVSEQNKESYEKQYISITRKEYETAREKGIPVMIFVEQNVYTEYRTYQTNKDSLPQNFRFAYVDDVKVFEFIASLEQNAIKAFNKVDDIEHYFTYQISSMLLSYLTQLQTERTSSAIKTAVEQINVASKSMQTMINSIAEKVLEGEKDKYRELLLQQNKELIDFFIDVFDNNTSWNMVNYVADDLKNIPINDICKILMKTLFDNNEINNIIQEKDLLKQYSLLKTLAKKSEEDIQNQSKNIKILVNISPLRFASQIFKIVKLIQNVELKKYFEEGLKNMIYKEFSLPF